jgi:tRNA threonylcarbamoyladenosine biosynthesis protein TsaE
VLEYSGMSDSHLELLLGDAHATEILGAALAQAYLRGGAGGAVVYLQGELGAGKTTCARSLLRTLGAAGVIRSPTYTLVEVYQPRGITCVHVDLYRLQGPSDVAELGLRDYFDGECLLLVEWPEKGRSVLPPADLDLVLRYHEEARRASLDAPTARGRQWLKLLQHDTSLTSYVSNLT